MPLFHSNSGGPVFLTQDADLNLNPRVFSVAVATEGGDAIQIAYGIPVSNILMYMKNWYDNDSSIGYFPRYDFNLMATRSEPWDRKHKFPSQALDGTVIVSTKPSTKYRDLRDNDVLVSINRPDGRGETKLDKRGFVVDPATHGELRLTIHNHGFICSLAPETTFTVWRNEERSLHTFKCRPAMPPVVERACHQEFVDPHYALLGSLVCMDATPDFLRNNGEGDEDEDEDDTIPVHKMFHVLRHMHDQHKKKEPNAVVVVSHFHPDAYVSSDGNLEVFDVLTHVAGIPLENSRHMETIVKGVAKQFVAGRTNSISVTIGKKTVFLDLHRLLAEETLVMAERGGDTSKLHLLTETVSGGKPARPKPYKSRSRAHHGAKRRSTRLQLKSILQTQIGAPVCPSSRPNSAPPSPAKKRRRRTRQRNINTSNVM